MTIQATFHHLVNMSPAAIRAWAKDPRRRRASFASTLARLPALAKLKAKRRSAWTARDLSFAKRVISFNARMQGVVNKHGCTEKAVVSLRNWGRKAPRCPLRTR